ncbi:hypothetical protein V5799_006179 [Amblyomma americanum]|uniref:FLYWCH-type domain-containing protein n=1 Tax=Amblyomma americanum TaxID=6943 RepID=A0AAQ4DX56_AMBAM
MSGAGVADDSVAPFAGVVELVPSRRGKMKAKYAGRTFTLETHNGQRHRWRCDVRHCKARLTTDVYGDQHMVYRFRGHDEDQHQRVASQKKRRLDIAYKQQSVKRIGDHRYVLDNLADGVHFWRCAFVSCPGRCRTIGGRVVAGPSEHLHEPRVEKQEPDRATQQVEDSSSSMDLRLDADKEEAPGVAESSKPDALPQQQPGGSNKESSGKIGSPVIIKSEPPSPLPSEEVASSEGVCGAGDDAGPAQRSLADHEIGAGGEGPHFRISGPSACAKGQSPASRTAAAVTVEDAEYVDSSDAGEENDVKHYSADDVSGGQLGLVGSSSRRHVDVADVLRMTSTARDNRERGLRADILLQMRRLS